MGNQQISLREDLTRKIYNSLVELADNNGRVEGFSMRALCELFDMGTVRGNELLIRRRLEFLKKENLIDIIRSTPNKYVVKSKSPVIQHNEEVTNKEPVKGVYDAIQEAVDKAKKWDKLQEFLKTL